ncbi:hypothetical protein BH24GEM3_BH24GEM3_06320 [soil metagenome]
MPIATDELNHDFLLVDDSATVREVRDRVAAAQSSWIYVVVRLADGRYAALRLTEIVEALQRQSEAATPGLLDTALVEVADLLSSHAAEAVEQESMSTRQAREQASHAPGRRLVVTANGRVLGVLAMEMRSASRGTDLEWLNGEGRRDAPELGVERGQRRGWGAEETRAPPAPARPRLLGGEEREGWTESAPPPAPVPEPKAEKRWLNAEIQDHPAGEPLQVAEVYTLAFDVDTELRAAALPGSTTFDYRFAAGEELVELTLQLSSGDFEIHTAPQQLRVPRTGKSKGKARFDIEPKQEGTGLISAILLREGNFIQLMTLKLQVGAASQPGVLAAETIGRPLAAAFEVRPRDLSLIIENTGTDFRLSLIGPVAARGTLPLTAPQVDQMIAQARQELLEIVNLEVGPSRDRVYQTGIDIPPEVNQQALRRLARVGFRLYQRLFYGGPAHDAQIRLLGDRLRTLAQTETLKIQIFSQNFPIPWGILYLAESYDPEKVDPELFLGLKHIIEQLPLQNDLHVTSRTIDSRAGLTVSLNVNADIDLQMGVPLVADQLGYWEKIRERGGVKLVVRRREEEVTQALADTACEDQILYFYCHAVSRSLSEGGGPDTSNLVLSGGDSLTLEELNLFAPLQKVLPCAPLVFINACESAELSPLFYEGFVPYFMAKGARGVIGTECATPALFATEWARRFFDHFLGSQSLGQLFLDLRREFYYRHHNLLGLLYALYCDADTQIVPGVEVA